jgi:hypothetical protein
MVKFNTIKEKEDFIIFFHEFWDFSKDDTIYNKTLKIYGKII